MKASLVIVGSGIKFLSHLTTEAKAYIQQSDKVLYLVNEPAMKEWIQKNSISAESLDPLYTQHPLRVDCYQAIANYILNAVRADQHVCVVLYGHPTVFSQIAIDAVKQARKEGIDSKILPGISAEDCLFADLLIDPGSCGCQSFETTDFLIRKRLFDPSSHLILWQVGSIGVLNHIEKHDNTQGARVLLDYLNHYYNVNHEVTLFEAAQYPHFEPRIEKFPLQQLPHIHFSRLSTLYIPPAHPISIHEEMLQKLGINKTDLK